MSGVAPSAVSGGMRRLWIPERAVNRLLIYGPTANQLGAYPGPTFDASRRITGQKNLLPVRRTKRSIFLLFLVPVFVGQLPEFPHAKNHSPDPDKYNG